MKTYIISIVIITALVNSLPAAMITWLTTSPVAVGSSVPSSTSIDYFLPGVGPVAITYNAPAILTNSRQQAPFLQNGTVAAGAYFWGPYEGIGTLSTSITMPVVPWEITYTFANPVNPNTLFLGVSGLGKSTAPSSGTTTVDVSQNGGPLGDFNAGMGFGATLFASSYGSFHLENFSSGPNFLNPLANTDLHVVQIQDMVSSLTVRVNQYRNDGIQIGLGAVVIPEPSSALLVAMTSLMVLRRRR